MSNKKWSNDDIQKWIDLYTKKKLSCQKISDLLKIPKSTIYKKLSNLGLMRNHSESQKKSSME